MNDICVTEHEFLLEGGRTGVLLVHGLTGTPNEMRMVGKGLHKAGFTVYGMQLAGHCGTSEDLLNTSRHDWSASVRAAAKRLRPQVDKLVVLGLSMGAVLSLELAADEPELVDGAVALSTMFWHDGWSIPLYTKLSFLLKPFRFFGIGRDKIFMEQPPYGIKDEALRKRIVAQMQSGDSSAAGLPGNPWWSIIEMRDLSNAVLKKLSAIRCPVLAVHAQHDDVSSVANAEVIAKRAQQAQVEIVLLHDSYHMITIDRERRTVINQAVAFVERVAPLTAAQPPSAAPANGPDVALAA